MSENYCNIWFGFDAAYSFVKTEKQGFKCFALNVFQLHEDSNYANYMDN